MVSSKPAEVFRRAREIRGLWRSQAVNPLRLAVLASFVAEPLLPYLIVEAEKIGCPLEPRIAPFATFEQLVLDSGSDLWTPEPDVLWIGMRLDDVSPEMVWRLARDGHLAVTSDLDELRQRLSALAAAARERCHAPILVSNLWTSPDMSGSLFDASDPNGFTHLLAAANRELARDLDALVDCHVFDEEGSVAEVGHRRWSDHRLRHAARIAPGAQGQTVLARRLVRSASALLRAPAKCIVLDLDNTLWGGVLGDDGIDGLALGDEYPGSVFKEFQRALLDLRSRGFLLAVASKNDLDKVLETLDSHPEMVLRREHFAAVKANWEPKSRNLVAIAEELSIGLDALLFVDDNPVERAQVARELPLVEILELPPDPVGFLPALRSSHSLDRPRLSPEDRRRGQLYGTEQERHRLRESAMSVGEFLRSLEMVATLGSCDGVVLTRVVQLLQKTNQFNLTTRRHTAEEVRRLVDAPDAHVLWLRLRDRFADLGLVCVGIVVERGPGLWEIDSLLMSCRVMGRRVEDAFLSFLLEVAAEHGAETVRGVYRATGRNHMTELFYASRGFSAAEEGEDGELVYELDLSRGVLRWPDEIRRGGAGS